MRGYHTYTGEVFTLAPGERAEPLEQREYRAKQHALLLYQTRGWLSTPPEWCAWKAALKYGVDVDPVLAHVKAETAVA